MAPDNDPRLSRRTALSAFGATAAGALALVANRSAAARTIQERDADPAGTAGLRWHLAPVSLPRDGVLSGIAWAIGTVADEDDNLSGHIAVNQPRGSDRRGS